MPIDLTPAETARLCRLLHLANDPADAALWEKLKVAHMANHEPAAPATDAPRHCGQPWVAEIELCPRCGLGGDKHPAAPLYDPITGHVIELNPVQTSVAGLTDAQVQDAYAAIKGRFKLRPPQRLRLSRASQYAAALTAAHAGDWKRVERLLGYAGVIE